MKFRQTLFGASLFAVTLSLPACAQQTSAPKTNVAAKAFIHPGLLHTDADFARMKAKVDAKEQPWLEGWEKLTTSPHAQLAWRPRPTERVVRGGAGQNFPVLFNDIHAAYQLALRWKVSDDEAYAKKSIEILNLWSGSLKEVTGNSDRFLAAGIYGYQFANAAEIMRSYSGWQKADFERFQNMMVTVFYPMNKDFLTNHNGAFITNYWANWDLCNIASMQAIGVLCDRRDIYDEAMNYFKTGRGNGALDKAVYYVHAGYLGQWQESGRDQGHNSLGIALTVPIMEAAWHQNDDLYGYDNNRFLAGAEYVAKYNLGDDNVPYQKYAWGIGVRGNHGEQAGISPAGRGAIRAGYEAIINHYVNLKGIAAPYSEQAAAKIRPESGGGGHASSFDQLGFGTLTATIEPQFKNPKPSGLTARKSGEAVVLSWWGAAGATSYTVKRAARAGGPYSAIASDVKDLLTFADKNAKTGNYFYIVTGQRGGKETPPSNEVRVATQPNLQTQLKFDETAGTKATDAVTNKPFGLLQGDAKFEAGKEGNALALNGQNGYAELPEGIVADLGDFTVATWVFLNDAKPWSRVFDFGDERGRYLFLTPSTGAGGKVRFATSTTFGHNEQVVDGDAALPTKQWVHVALTLSGHVGTVYVNGKAVGSNANMDFPPFHIGKTTRNWIGRSQFPNDAYLKGKVDNFRIYDGALSAEQIAALATGK